MVDLYSVVLVTVVIIALMLAFKTGYAIGTKQTKSDESKFANKPNFIDNIKEIISDIVYPVIKKKETGDDDIDTVETADGRQKEVRKFF